MQKPLAVSFEKISFSVLLGTLALLPFIFLPDAIAGMGAVKGVVLYVGVLISAVCWLIAAFIEGSFSYIRSWIFGTMVLAILFSGTSALLSANTHVSLWARGFSIDSVASVILFGVLLFLIASYCQDKLRLRTLFFTLFFSGALTIVLQCILFLMRTIPFIARTFSSVTTSGTIVGSWTEFSFYSAFVFVFALLIVELFRPKGVLKGITIATAGVALLTLVFLNYTAAWLLVLIVALLIFIYKMSVERSLSTLSSEEGAPRSNTTFPTLSFIALLVGIFFIISSASIGASLSRFAGVSFTDVRPSISTSVHIARNSLLHDPLFGAGSGRYGNAYDAYQPSSIVLTGFWNTTFENGYNVLLTILVTLGLLPTICFVVLFCMLIILAVRVIGKSIEEYTMRFMAITSAALFFFLCASIFLVIPGIVNATLVFVCGGILIGTALSRGLIGSTTVHFLKDPRTSFFAVTGMTVAILVGAVSVYMSGTRFASVVLYNRALVAPNIPTALTRLSRADSLSHNDIFYRTAAALYLNTFTTESQNKNPDGAVLQQQFSAAEQSARAAIAWDVTNASNWYTLGQVYQLAVGSNKDAIQQATSAVTKAASLRPYNPLFALSLAQLSLLAKDQQEALAHLDEAIALKPNYLDAYALKAQIKQSGGDSDGAASSIRAYITNAPNDDKGYAVFGILMLDQKNYTDALSAFGRARTINPNEPSYSLFYIKTLYISGNSADADKEKEQFKKTFPSQATLVDNLSAVQPVLPTPDTTSATDTTPKSLPSKKK